MIPVPRTLRLWGLFGALIAAFFAVWLLFFPQFVPNFAWNVQPRAAQAFIGAGYAYRTFFFLLFFFVPDWRRLRWTYYGNLLFTGTLLLATLWHAPEMHWRTVIGHFWIVFYTMEPVIMHFNIPKATGAPEEPLTTGGPVLSPFRWFLIIEVGAALVFGLALVINPEWLNTRWPWPLNPFDARIAAAWWLGWVGWAGGILQARDWDEVRLGAVGNLIVVACFLVAGIVFRPYFTQGHPTVWPYIIGMAVLTLGLGFFIWQQERHRPATQARGDIAGAQPLPG